ERNRSPDAAHPGMVYRASLFVEIPRNSPEFRFPVTGRKNINLQGSGEGSARHMPVGLQRATYYFIWTK
ncbi:MAG: hypothetical protein NHB36_07850, partial [Nitrospira sp.]|nr:hypothetical protein [Nitrospira sp.]